MPQKMRALLAVAAISYGAIGIMATHEAHAALIKFVYTDTISNTDIPGLSSGEAVTLDLFADNGGTSLTNQAWTYAETKGFVVSSGAYVGNFSAVFVGGSQSDIAVSTDGSGNVTEFSIYGTDSSSVNSDNYGNWTGDTVYGNWGLNDGAGYYLNFSNSPPSNPQNVTAELASGAPTPAPEPVSVTLLGTGIAALVAARRRRRARPLNI